MRHHPTHLAYTALLLGGCLGLTGCAHKSPEGANAALSVVTVSYPVEREVTAYADFTARTAAVESVELRARVSGYLDQINFKEGALVKKGDVLFRIDPRPYKAGYDSAVAQINLNLAQLKLAIADNARAKEVAKTPGAISKQDLDRYAALEGTAEASVAFAKANAELARLKLEYSEVVSPISGRVSRYYVTVGNLVQAGDLTGGTLLTTIVSVDPIYVYFDVDERTVLRVLQLISEGKAPARDAVDIPVWIGLANEKGYPHQGTINFIDNQVNPKTGTLKVRGVFPNKDERIFPGYFARVRVPISNPHKALLVTERALDTDQGQKIVYVVDQDNKVSSRPVLLGALHDGLREIIDGLKPGERVIVNGLQQVRPGVTVEANLVPMPSSKTGKVNTPAGTTKVAAKP